MIISNWTILCASVGVVVAIVSLLALITRQPDPLLRVQSLHRKLFGQLVRQEELAQDIAALDVQIAREISKLQDGRLPVDLREYIERQVTPLRNRRARLVTEKLILDGSVEDTQVAYNKAQQDLFEITQQAFSTTSTLTFK